MCPSIGGEIAQISIIIYILIARPRNNNYFMSADQFIIGRKNSFNYWQLAAAADWLAEEVDVTCDEGYVVKILPYRVIRGQYEGVFCNYDGGGR